MRVVICDKCKKQEDARNYRNFSEVIIYEPNTTRRICGWELCNACFTKYAEERNKFTIEYMGGVGNSDDIYEDIDDADQ